MIGVFWAVLGVLVLVWLYNDFAWPVLYRMKARKLKLAVPPFNPSRPLGIGITAQFVKAAGEDRLLRLIGELDLNNSSRTSFRQSLGRWTVRTREPDNLKAILATKFNDFDLDRPFMRRVFGSGIFTQDGMPWKHSRAMLRPQFSKDQVSRIDTVSQHIDTLINVVKERQEAGFAVDMQHYFHLLTMDTATSFLFGDSVDSLNFSPETRGAKVTDPKTGKTVMSADFVDSYTWLNRFAFYGMIMKSVSPFMKFKPEFKRHLNRAQMFIDHYVHEALEATADLTPEEKEAVPDRYIFSHELAKETRDPVVIRDQIFNILIAGRDTTASTLSYSTYYLAKYPEELAKVREEILDLLPEGTPITYENLRKLQYTQFFIKEVLRLAPVVPLNLRVATRNTSLPRGGGPDGDQPIFIPKGTEVQYSVYTVHRDPVIYGDDVLEFKPSRWAPENKRPDSHMYSWGYLPFNGGPRICLGQQFALTEIALTLVKLLRVFDTFEQAPGFPEDIRPDRTFLTLQLGGKGVPVRLLRRGNI